METVLESAPTGVEGKADPAAAETAKEIYPVAEVEGLQADNAALTDANAVLTEELAAARQEVDRLTAALAKAEQKASVTTKAHKAPKARVAGPIKDALTGNELRELLRDGAVEIVFSDGKKEIAGLPALQVAGPAWSELSGGRLVLREAQTIKADRTVDLAGFALFDDEGTQIGWCELPSPMPLSAGMQVRLDRQILFG